MYAARKLWLTLFIVASVISAVGAVATATARPHGTTLGSTPSQVRSLSLGASLIQTDGIRMGD